MSPLAKKAVIVLAVIFVGYLIWTAPILAADLTKGAAGGLLGAVGTVFRKLRRFLRRLSR